MPHPDNGKVVVDGPPIAYWDCPCCGETVQRLLPNGRLNRHAVSLRDTVLPHPDLLATAQNYCQNSHWDICLSCHQTLLELLGALVAPTGGQGTVLAEQAETDSLLIGALLPGAATRGGLLLLFDEQDNSPVLRETQALRDFKISRITYPATQGKLSSLLWSLYQQRIEQLKQLLGKTLPDGMKPE